MFDPPIDSTQLPLQCFQASPLRDMIEAELSIVVMDAAVRGMDVTVTQELAIHDAVVPAIFFRALESGKLTLNGAELTAMDMTVDFLQWLRVEVRKSVLGMLGMEM